MATVDLTKDNFKETYEKNDLVVVDFWASWCGPCKSFAPVYEAVSEKHPDVVFGKVDTEAEQELASYFGIRSIPTLMVIREGMELYFEPGALAESQLAELIQKAKAVDMAEVKKLVEEEEKKIAAEASATENGSKE